MKATKIAIPIRRLGCASSAHVIERSLANARGVLDAYVNPAFEVAYVEYDADRCDPRDLATLLGSMGYHDVESS